MFRRSSRPFTVEVRTLSEKPKRPTHAPKPSMPKHRSEYAEEIQVKPEIQVPEGVVLTGRVLPALDRPEPVVAEAVTASEPKRRGRSASRGKAAASARAEDEARNPAVETETAFLAADMAPLKDLAVPSDPAPVVTHETSEALLPSVDTKAVAATLLLRQGRARLSRSDFSREDRWKARLPAAVHRAGRGRSLG